MKNIRVILGTNSFGDALNEEQSHEFIKDFIKLGHQDLDTAIMYQDGETEKLIGNLKMCQNADKVRIACKANPFQGFKSEDVVKQMNTSLESLCVPSCVIFYLHLPDHDKFISRFKSEDIVKQLNTSLESLCVPSCDIFYLHLPDHNISIEETLKGVDQLYKDGKFKEFGLSNYASWEVADIYHICKANGYVRPTVYQGMYNALTRDIELELLPALRRFGMRFYVYNPLAGGLLTEKYDFSVTDENQPEGRFFCDESKNNFTSKWASAYRDRFWRDNYKDGVQLVSKVVQEVYSKEVTLLEASIRWLNHHSMLADGDGVVLGFSKVEHFKQNMDAAHVTEPLHEDVVNAFDEAWNRIKSDCPKYYR